MIKSKDSKVLIIGGSGFVGSRLIDEIGEKNCINLDKKQSPKFPSITTIGDIRYIEQINIPVNCSTVILLAAEHRDDVNPTSLYYDVNVKGTINVLKKIDSSSVSKLIFTSSVAVYGLNKDNPTETHVKEPFNHYGKSKLKAEKAIIDWNKKSSVKRSVTIIRPTVIFGERNRGNVYNLLSQIYSKKFVMVGNGKNKKSMAYVGNIVSFINQCINKKSKNIEIFNYADKPDLSMSELVSFVESKNNSRIINVKIPYMIALSTAYIFDLFSLIFRRKFLISSVRVKKFCATTQFNATKAHSVFNPSFSLKKGLNNTLDYEFFQKKKEEDNIVFYSE